MNNGNNTNNHKQRPTVDDVVVIVVAIVLVVVLCSSCCFVLTRFFCIQCILIYDHTLQNGSLSMWFHFCFYFFFLFLACICLLCFSDNNNDDELIFLISLSLRFFYRCFIRVTVIICRIRGFECELMVFNRRCMFWCFRIVVFQVCAAVVDSQRIESRLKENY